MAKRVKSKEKYKIKNWHEYNNSLRKRGSITLFVSDDVLDEWRKIDPTIKVVGQKTYPDTIIECCQLLKHQFHLPLRQAQGFITSIFSLMPSTQGITSIRSHIYFDKDPHFVDNKTRPLEGTRNDEDSTSEQGSSFRE
ncbi:transposase, partial [Breznakiellaceae bacterium SP9]